MKKNLKKLLLCLAVPLAVGALSAWLTKDNMILFECIRKPPLSPPGWLFPVVWTLLYLLMGLASYFVSTSGKPKKQVNAALTLYGVQLFFNFLWSILFFNLGNYLLALVWLLVLWLLIIATTRRFFAIDKRAGWLMLPYLAWVTFAAYLNYGIYKLN